MSKTEINRANLHRWYQEVWGKGDASQVPAIVAPVYLRHDMLGANAPLTAEQYRDLLAPYYATVSAEKFSYFLIAEGDYVGSFGCYIFDNGLQWDWIQLFRLENGANRETWLPGMGSTDPQFFFNSDNMYTGIEIPAPLPSTENKQLVKNWYEALIAKDSGRAKQLLADQVRVHDFEGADRTISAQRYFDDTVAKLGETVSDFQLFMIEENDILFALGSWKIDGTRQWDWTQAFQMLDNRIVRTWLPAVNTSDRSIAHSPDHVWTAELLPKNASLIC